jgi:hypothetical protein
MSPNHASRVAKPRVTSWALYRVPWDEIGKSVMKSLLLQIHQSNRNGKFADGVTFFFSSIKMLCSISIHITAITRKTGKMRKKSNSENEKIISLSITIP